MASIKMENGHFTDFFEQLCKGPPTLRSTCQYMEVQYMDFWQWMNDLFCTFRNAILKIVFLYGPITETKNK